MDHYQLGAIVGLETLETEFKEFCLRDVKIMESCELIDEDFNISEFTMRDIKDIIHSKSIDDKMMNIIFRNIRYYANILPKYISSFFNAEVDGTLYIGINDFGEVTGIPVKHGITEAHILSEFRGAITDVLQNNLFIFDPMTDKSPKDWIFDGTKIIDMDYIHISVHKIHSQFNTTDDILFGDTVVDIDLRNIISDYEKAQLDLKHDMQAFRTSYYAWYKELRTYRIALQVFIDNRLLRLEIIDHINEMTNLERSDDAKININNINHPYRNVIDLLRSDEPLIIPMDGDVATRKLDKHDYIHWLTEYKDYMAAIIGEQKPVKPVLRRTVSPYTQLRKLSPLRQIFIENDEVDYYLIKINILGSRNTRKNFGLQESHCNRNNPLVIRYYNPMKNKSEQEKEGLIYGMRSIKADGDPFCY